MRPRGLAVALALMLVAATGCTTASPPAVSSGGASGGASSGSAPGLAMDDVDAEPLERAEAGIGMAFDATGAAELVVEVPDDLDFEQRALVCVYLGERPTGGWALDLDSAFLVDGELRIEAREGRPRGDGGELDRTYPADCATINRRALPVGELPVRADDTLSDEFIVSGTVTVPGP